MRIGVFDKSAELQSWLRDVGMPGWINKPFRVDDVEVERLRKEAELQHPNESLAQIQARAVGRALALKLSREAQAHRVEAQKQALKPKPTLMDRLRRPAPEAPEPEPKPTPAPAKRVEAPTPIQAEPVTVTVPASALEPKPALEREPKLVPWDWSVVAKWGFRIVVVILLLLILLFGVPLRSHAQSRSLRVQVQDEGAIVASRGAGNLLIFDCTGAGVTCSLVSGKLDINVTGGGATGYQTVEDEGIGLTQRTILNFTGAGVACVDNVTKTDCDITSGGGLTHTVNGSALASATAIDFDDAIPAAPANGFNMKWQKDALDPTNVSAYFDTTSYASTTVGSGSTIVETWNVGATDPVWTVATGVMNLTTGALQQNGDDVIHKGTNTLLSTENVILDGSTNPRDITLGILRIVQTPNIDSTRGIAVITDAAGFGDTKAIELDWTATGVAAGDFEAVIDIDIDTANSTGGNIIALEVTETTTGSAAVYGMLTGVGINPILNEAGTFINIETAFISIPGFTDVTADFNSTGSDVQMFVSNGDLVYIGMAAKFDEVEFILAITASNAGIQPTFEYSDGALGWITFSPTDNTNGMRQNGDLVWIASALAGWAQDTVNAVSGKFWIRITRGAVTVSTPPTEDLVQVNTDIDYIWDSSGNLNIASLSSGFNTEIADAGFIRCANNEICMAWELATPGADKTLIVDASDILQFNGTFNATALTEGGVNVVVDSFTITTGDGLSGGGDFTSNRTFAVDLNATVDGVGSTSNLSGLEFTATNELALLQGCSDALPVLKWTEASSLWGCAADVSGGSPTLDSIADPVAATDWIFGTTAETLLADFQAAFTTGPQVEFKQSVGNPTGGILVRITVPDVDVTPFDVFDGTNVVFSVAQDGTTTVGNSTAGGVSIFGGASDTGASALEVFGGDGASNIEPAYLQLHQSATGEDAFLFPCDTDGAMCLSGSTPSADSSNVIMTLQTTEEPTNKTLDGGLATTTHAANANFLQNPRHATDCTAITDGKDGEFCWERDADTIYACENAAGCAVPGDWIRVTAAGGASHELLSATHTDTTTATVVRGDIPTGQLATPKWQRLAIGTGSQFLGNDGTDILWEAVNFTDLAGSATAGQVPNLESLNGTLDIGSGGTGQTTANAAFNALSPVTTEGDLIFRNATVNARLARGSDGQCLLSSTTTILWGSCAAGGNEFDDDVFRVRDDGDTTRKLAFQVSGVDTATTRTWTVPNSDLIVAGANFDNNWSVNQTFADTVDILLNNAGNTFSTSVITGVQSLSGAGGASGDLLFLPGQSTGIFEFRTSGSVTKLVVNPNTSFISFANPGSPQWYGMELTSDAAIAVGDVVKVSATTDDRVIVATTSGDDENFVGIAQEVAGAAGVVIKIAVGGIITNVVNDGGCTRGDFAKVSATTAGRIECTTTFDQAMIGMVTASAATGAATDMLILPRSGSAGGTHAILSAAHTDTTAAAVVRGDVMIGQTATPVWQRQALGGTNLYLKSDGTDLLYSTLAAGGVGSCTNQFVSALNADAAPTCATVTASDTDETTFTGVTWGANADFVWNFNTVGGANPDSVLNFNSANINVSTGTLSVAGNLVVDLVDVPNAAGDISGDYSAGLTIDAGSVASAELATANKSFSRGWTIIDPTTGDTNFGQIDFPAAITITEVRCSTNGTATPTVTIQLDERAEATPNTAGTNVMTSSLVCDGDTQKTSTFTNAGIAADVPLNLQITATGGTVTVVRISVQGTID